MNLLQEDFKVPLFENFGKDGKWIKISNDHTGGQSYHFRGDNMTVEIQFIGDKVYIMNLRINLSLRKLNLSLTEYIEYIDNFSLTYLYKNLKSAMNFVEKIDGLYSKIDHAKLKSILLNSVRKRNKLCN